jgi:hypothetical protein
MDFVLTPSQLAMVVAASLASKRIVSEEDVWLTGMAALWIWRNTLALGARTEADK